MWLIDGNALLEEIDEQIDLYDDDSNREETLIRLGLKIARKDIVKQQGVEVTKQAEWKINSDGYYPYCSNCKNEPPGREMTVFCPNCGAKMKGDNND